MKEGLALGAFVNQNGKAHEEDNSYFVHKSGGKPVFVASILGKKLVEEDHLIVDQNDGQLYRYTNGVYRPGAELWVQQRCKALLEDEWRSSYVEETLKWIMASGRIDLTAPRVPQFINVKNGILDWRTVPPTLRPHTPHFYSQIQIPVEWHQDAQCPEISKFFSEVVPPDTISLLSEVIGYCLIPTSSMRKAILLTGPGANGKTTLLELIRALLGPQNVSSESLQRLAENRFAPAELYGKLANIFGDLDSRSIDRTDQFKTLTGGDEIPAERKYGHPFTFRNFAKPLFSANEVPMSRDQTQAWFDRWIVVPMERRFEGTGKQRSVSQHELLAKLTTRVELEGLLVHAVGAAQQLFARGHFEIPASVQDANDKYRARLDTIRTFIDECCELHPEDESMWVNRAKLYEAYEAWAKGSGLRALSAPNFYDRLRRDFGLEDKRTMNDRRFLCIELIDNWANH